MRKVLLTVIVAAAVIIGSGLVFVYSGVYSVAADAPDNALVAWVLRTTRQRSVAAYAKDIAVPAPSELDAMLAEGFRHYQANCVECHGAPGVQRGEAGRGLNPAPPDLAKTAAALDAREIFWLVKHGIRMTGMPAWGATHRDDELWAVTAFVQRLPSMSAAEYRALQAKSPREHSHKH